MASMVTYKEFLKENTTRNQPQSIHTGFSTEPYYHYDHIPNCNVGNRNALSDNQTSGKGPKGNSTTDGSMPPIG